MTALNNAHPKVGGETIDSPLCDGLVSNALPEAQSSKTGVSVENALTATGANASNQNTPPLDKKGKLQWFVLRASYGRAIKASDILKENNITTFNPLHKVMKMVNGKRRRVQLPLLPGLIFAQTEAATLSSILQDPSIRSLISYYYDHFSIGTNGYNPPLVVPDAAMNSFIKALTADSHDVRVVNPEHVHYKSGDIVRVTVGEFEGVVGRVARAAGQQRVIINLEGLCLVATAYIPTGCLEVITPAELVKCKRPKVFYQSTACR